MSLLLKSGKPEGSAGLRVAAEERPLSSANSSGKTVSSNDLN
jgi:hypothetical protein